MARISESLLCYGRPAAPGPQKYPCLREIASACLDEARHVGIDDQPFYYGGMLNVFKMRSNLARMNLNSGSSLAEGKPLHESTNSSRRGGGTIGIYYHPNEWVQTEFWDAVNFRRGANPPRADGRGQARGLRTRPNRPFKTSEMRKVHQSAASAVRDGDRAPRNPPTVTARTFSSRSSTARTRCKEITFQQLDSYTLGGRRVRSSHRCQHRGNAWPSPAKLAALDGPITLTPSIGGVRSSASPGAPSPRQFASSMCRTFHRLPDEIWIGRRASRRLTTLPRWRVLEELTTSGHTRDVTRLEGHFTADRYVAEDSVQLWS